jgi:hyperosmotically inducible protein
MVRMSPFTATMLACLLAACGRVGEDPRLQAAASSERVAVAQPPAEQGVGDAPQAAAAPAALPSLPPPEALTDPAITARIESALKADPAMKGADISINTDAGVVVLSGTVKSHEQTGIASGHAQRQDGVMRVDNHLKPQLS